MTAYLGKTKEVARVVNRFLLWMLISLPVLFIGTYLLKVWKMGTLDVAVTAVATLVLCVLPTILEKKGASDAFVQYFGLIAVQLVVVGLAGRGAVGVYISYVLCMALSCLYFDAKLTRNMAIVGYFTMLASLGVRASSEAAGAIDWFVASWTWLTIEFAALAACFFLWNARMDKVLGKLKEVERAAAKVGESDRMAEDLHSGLGVVNDSIQSMEDYIHKMADVMNQSLDGFHVSKSKISHSLDDVRHINESMEGISSQTGSLLDIADETFGKTKDFVKTMNDAVDSMKKIEAANEVTKKATEDLNQIMQEVMKFSEIIGQLSAQTNILAINASIEAARAGEDGRGFAIVASQVGELAMESKEAAQNITMQITEMQDEMEKVMESVRDNTRSIGEGVNYIVQVKEGAKHLGELQETSKNKAKQIVKQCERSKEYSERMTAVTSDVLRISESSMRESDYVDSYLDEGNEKVKDIRTLFERLGETAEQMRSIAK